VLPLGLLALDTKIENVKKEKCRVPKFWAHIIVHRVRNFIDSTIPEFVTCMYELAIF